MKGSAPPVTDRRRWLAAGATLACAAAPGVLLAQPAFPARPVTLVVPYPPGGASDIGARMINAEVGRRLGQPMLVENVSGAGGALGVRRVARAAADGHTLLYGSLSEVLLVPMRNAAIGYRPQDLQAVAFAGSSAVALVARPDFPARTLDEFVALARRNPGKYTYGSPGVGTFQHLMGEAFKTRAGVFMVHIPYRGGAQILTDVISGQIDVGLTTVVNAAGMVRAGRLKALGVTSATRSRVMPDVQCFGETRALSGLELSTWAVVFAPAATGVEVVGRLADAINAALTTPEARARRERLGADLDAVMTPAQARAFVAAEQAKYQPIVASLRER